MKSIKILQSPEGPGLAQIGECPRLVAEINFCDVIGDMSEKTSDIFLLWAKRRKVTVVDWSIPVGLYKEKMLLDFLKFLAVAEFLTCGEEGLDIINEYPNL